MRTINLIRSSTTLTQFREQVNSRAREMRTC